MERLSVDNISFLARNSMSHTKQRLSQVSLLTDTRTSHHSDDRNWSWKYLRDRFRIEDLEKLYDRYYVRILNSYFNVYLVTQVILSLVYILILTYFTLVEDKGKPEDCDGVNGTIPVRCKADLAIFLALPEMVTHGIILLSCGIMYLLVSDEKLFKSETHGHKLQIICSIAISGAIVSVDAGLTLYYFFKLHVIRTPLAFPTIIVIYYFLPFPKKYQAAIVGLSISLIHLIIAATLHSVDDCHEESAVRRVFAEAVFYLCGNAVGLYSQMMNEITIRRAFLDRRGFIKSTIKKNYEKLQEEHLLASILPDHIAKRVKDELRNAIDEYGDESEDHSRKRSNVSNVSNLSGRGPSPGGNGVIPKKLFSELFVERHENVSILFADIVNFTPLTVRLRPDELVETLNLLFGRFDAAATRHQCTRIKLLGDCYYAVAGLQNQTPDHAKNCVRFGFEMIEIIKDVRDVVKVDVNMRIGIHSGNILSGLLGIYKWQFDIWSKDVTIANHMEQNGLPGRVHITKQTKDFLGSEFINLCKSSQACGKQQKDKYLEENNIETFFLTPPKATSPSVISTPSNGLHLTDSVDSLEEEDEDYVAELATPRSMYVRGHVSHTSGAAITPRRNNSLSSGIADLIRKKSARVGSFVAGSSDVYKYLQMMNEVNETMKQAIDEMPLRKIDVYCRDRKNGHKNSINIHVNPVLMNFDEFSSEIRYQTQPDPLFKYYIGCALFVLVCIGILQVIAIAPQERSVLWILLAVGCIFLVILVPFVWVGHLWTQIKDPHRELDVIPLPQNRLIRLFFLSSHKITSSSGRRTVLYFCIAILISFFAIIDVVECETEKKAECKFPWYYTYSCTLAILTTYTFFRIHFALKLIICLIALAGYGSTIFYYRKNLFQKDGGGSPGLSAVDNEMYSHLVYLLGVSAMLHIMDRQMEYINRLDFIWKRRLTEEHKEATLTHSVNTVLIHNILPTQIAKIYLDPYRSNESHSRSYQNVAVMFASIPHFMDIFTNNDSTDELKGLEVLNQIITDFDKALFDHIDVEKIKVIGSTFMAACGLEVQESGRLSATSLVPSDVEYNNPTWKDSDHMRSVVNLAKRKETLRTLVTFASDMMVRLQTINKDNDLDFHLRVGIATGLVVAGVVGSQKPLYDIWGDTVNLASRMDSHGSPDKIQVSAYCADLLMGTGIKCEQRGSVQIKGKGNMITYYVVLDENFKIVYDSKYPNDTGNNDTNDNEDDQSTDL